MTDKEIIKALECCRDIDIKCETCQLWTVSECTKVLHQATLALINRQQAEIERLATEKDSLIKTYSECQVDNLQEFGNRLRNKLAKLANNMDISMLGYQLVIYDMEQTYKEMVGEG